MIRRLSATAARAATAIVLSLVLAASAHAEKTRILLLASFGEELADLTNTYPDLELVLAKNPDEMAQKIGDVDAVVGLGPGPKLGSVIAAAGKDLRWIQTSSAGAEEFVAIPELVRSDVVLTNARIIQGPGVSDHAMALLLTLTRDMKWWNELMKTGFKQELRLPIIELHGKTALVVGFGGIGHQAAQRAAGFGMRVLAVDVKDMPLTRDVESVSRPDRLNELLPQADVLFLTVPWTKESQGMIGREQIALMKPTAYLINVARGPIVDTAALTEALQAKKLAGAGLDVTEPEPLPSDHPLWSMNNVIISPHAAGQMDGLRGRLAKLYRENIERFLDGRPLLHVVDKQKGF
jgi:phosphoglycerate dehydrogenase-like enzyme